MADDSSSIARMVFERPRLITPAMRVEVKIDFAPANCGWSHQVLRTRYPEDAVRDWRAQKVRKVPKTPG